MKSKILIRNERKVDIKEITRVCSSDRRHQLAFLPKGVEPRTDSCFTV